MTLWDIHFEEFDWCPHFCDLYGSYCMNLIVRPFDSQMKLIEFRFMKNWLSSTDTKKSLLKNGNFLFQVTLSWDLQLSNR